MALDASSIWRTLGIDQTANGAAIRRAYARQLKLSNPEDDAAGFQALRAAYERALGYARFAEMAAEEKSREGLVLDDELGGAELDADFAIVADLLPSAEAEIASSAAQPDTAGRIDQLSRRLWALVVAQEKPGPGVLVTALEAILRSAEMDNVATYAETEQWLAGLISQHQPRTDTLVRPTVSFFGWNSKNLMRPGDWVIARVLARERSIAFLLGIQSPRHLLHPAYQVLSKPVAWWAHITNRLQPRLLAEIRTVMTAVESQNFELDIRLDQSSLDWWVRYFSRPQPPPGVLIAGLLLTAVVGLVGAGLVTSGDGDHSVRLILACAAALVTMPLVLLATYAVIWPRWLWETHFADRRAPLWARLGWSVGALALLFAAAALPPGPIGATFLAVVGVGLFLWAIAATGPDRRTSNLVRPFRILLSQLPFMAWWLFSVVWWGPHALMLSLAVAGCLVCFGGGAGRLIEWWTAEHPARRPRLWMAGLLVAAVGAFGLAVAQLGDPNLTPWAIAMVAAASLVSRLPADTLDPNVGRNATRISAVLDIGALIFIGPHLERPVAFTLVSGWLLVRVLVTYVASRGGWNFQRRAR